MEAVRETAVDLYRPGFIDQRKMRKCDALHLDPIPAYDSERIRSLRERYQLSQVALGDKHPSGPSQKLLNLLEREGMGALI